MPSLLLAIMHIKIDIKGRVKNMGKEVTEEKKEIMILDENKIRDLIYVVRGQKVMLDMDLAKIYGYSTKRFNEQVKNNIERFDEDFRFQLTKEELENLRSKISTSSWGGNRYLPYAFTEQGIYMLMTVLKGDLAVQQSKALIRIFKKMKDHIMMNRGLIGDNDFFRLSMQVTQNVLVTAELREDLKEVEEQLAEVIESFNDVVTYSELSACMKEFGEPHIKEGYIIYNGQPYSSDLIFAEIYSAAKKTITIIDNYISLKSLQLLINSYKGVEISIFTDNLSKELTKSLYEDFCKEYPDIKLAIYKSGGIFHDRYIALDYDTGRERIFLCGASSKDGGRRISSILEDKDREKYRAMFHKLTENKQLLWKIKN